MKKKPDPLYRRWWFPYVSAGLILPVIGFIVSQVSSVWSAPQEIKTVKEAVIQNSETNKKLTDLAEKGEKKDMEQDAEIEKGKEISQLQIDSLKELFQQMRKK